jgi:hypothetical protein
MSVRERRRALTLVAALGLAAMLAIASPAAADRYEPREAGHPLRIVAYVLHPVGVLIDTLIFRPAHWIGSFEPLATLFGHQHD